MTDPAARAQAWGEVDRAITALAPAVPLVWDKVPMAHSADVAAVAEREPRRLGLRVHVACVSTTL